MDPLKMQTIHRNVIEDFFKKKEIISDEREIDTIYRANLKMELEANCEIKKSNFMTIISKAIMRGSLKNIYNFMKMVESGTKTILTEDLEFS